MTSEAQLDEARLSVERNVMGRIYSSAVYPNGDGDVMRDEVLSDHIKRISKNITPDCPELPIPKVPRFWKSETLANGIPPAYLAFTAAEITREFAFHSLAGLSPGMSLAIGASGNHHH